MEGNSNLNETPAVSNEAGKIIPTEEPSSPIENSSSPREPNPVEGVEENGNGGQGESAKPRPPLGELLILLSSSFLLLVRNKAPNFEHTPGFPHFILRRNYPYPSETYASSLFASGHGYATFIPETITPVPDDFKARRGISIGDVGILSEENDFIFAFNIFLAADHPYNKGKTPDSFRPLVPLNESEICTTVDFFPRGSVIASKGVEVERHSEEPLWVVDLQDSSPSLTMTTVF